MRPYVTLGLLTARGETGRNEQCITLHPLTVHGETGPYKTVCHFIPINGPLFRWAISSPFIFRPSQSPFILGLISSIRLLTVHYCRFLLVGQIQPVVTVGPFVVR